MLGYQISGEKEYYKQCRIEDAWSQVIKLSGALVS